MVAKVKTDKAVSDVQVFCTVCPKWQIKRPQLCSNTLMHNGRKHYFCTAKCKERFEKNPQKFLA